jgi:hypothetical protein
MPTLYVKSEAVHPRVTSGVNDLPYVRWSDKLHQFVVSFQRRLLFGKPVVVDRENDKLKFVGL